MIIIVSYSSSHCFLIVFNVLYLVSLSFAKKFKKRNNIDVHILYFEYNYLQLNVAINYVLYFVCKCVYDILCNVELIVHFSSSYS